MFISFFPQPRLFFTSAALWTVACVLIWFLGGEQLGAYFGLPPAPADAPPVVGVSVFWSKPFLWFYIYFGVAAAMFYFFWARYAPHSWQGWSIAGSMLIIFITYFSVQVSIALNNWRGPFYDMIQEALTKPGSVTTGRLYVGVATFFLIASLWILVAVFQRFFTSHYVFRWRTAMNDYYIGHWTRLRHIEGASQRVQEDTMRFASITESLGVAPDRLGHDTDRVSACACDVVPPCQRIADCRSNSLSAGPRGNLLVVVRNVRARSGRCQTARSRISQPARRSGLPQGARLWRGQRQSSAAARH